MLAGDVPRGLGALSNLTYFSLGLNKFSGVLSKDLFVGLVNLDYLNLSLNSLKLEFSVDWVLPFRLNGRTFWVMGHGASISSVAEMANRHTHP